MNLLNFFRLYLFHQGVQYVFQLFLQEATAEFYAHLCQTIDQAQVDEDDSQRNLLDITKDIIVEGKNSLLKLKRHFVLLLLMHAFHD